MSRVRIFKTTIVVKDKTEKENETKKTLKNFILLANESKTILKETIEKIAVLEKFYENNSCVSEHNDLIESILNLNTLINNVAELAKKMRTLKLICLEFTEEICDQFSDFRPTNELDLQKFTTNLSMIRRLQKTDYTKTFKIDTSVTDAVLLGEIVSDHETALLVRTEEKYVQTCRAYEDTFVALKDKNQYPSLKAAYIYFILANMQIIAAGKETKNSMEKYNAAWINIQKAIALLPVEKQHYAPQVFYLAAHICEYLHLESEAARFIHIYQTLKEKAIDSESKSIMTDEQKEFLNSQLTIPVDHQRMWKKLSSKKPIKERLIISPAQYYSEHFNNVLIKQAKPKVIVEYTQHYKTELNKIIKLYFDQQADLLEMVNKMNTEEIIKMEKEYQDERKPFSVSDNISEKQQLLAEELAPHPEVCFFTHPTSLRIALKTLLENKLSNEEKLFDIAHFYLQTGNLEKAALLFEVGCHVSQSKTEEFNEKLDIAIALQKLSSDTLSIAREHIPLPKIILEDEKHITHEKINQLKECYQKSIIRHEFLPLSNIILELLEDKNNSTIRNISDQYIFNMINYKENRPQVLRDFYFSSFLTMTAPSLNHILGKFDAACRLAQATQKVDYLSLALDERKKAVSILNESKKSFPEDLTHTMVSTVICLIHHILNTSKPEYLKQSDYLQTLKLANDMITLVPATLLKNHPLLYFFRGYILLKLEKYDSAHTSLSTFHKLSDPTEYKKFIQSSPRLFPELLEQIKNTSEEKLSLPKKWTIHYQPNEEFIFENTLSMEKLRITVNGNSNLKNQVHDLLECTNHLFDAKHSELERWRIVFPYFIKYNICRYMLIDVAMINIISNYYSYLEAPAKRVSTHPSPVFPKTEPRRKTTSIFFTKEPAISREELEKIRHDEKESKARRDEENRRAKRKARHDRKLARLALASEQAMAAAASKIKDHSAHAEEKTTKSSLFFTTDILHISHNDDKFIKEKKEDKTYSSSSSLTSKIKNSMFDLIKDCISEIEIQKMLSFINEWRDAETIVLLCGSATYKARSMAYGKPTKTPLEDIDLIIMKSKTEKEKNFLAFLRTLSEKYNIKLTIKENKNDHYLSISYHIPRIKIVPFKIDMTVRLIGYEETPDPIYDTQEKCIITPEGILTPYFPTPEKIRLNTLLDYSHHHNCYYFDFETLSVHYDKVINPFFRLIKLDIRRELDGVFPSADLSKTRVLFDVRADFLLYVICKQLIVTPKKLLTDMSRCYAAGYFSLPQAALIIDAFILALLSKIMTNGIPNYVFFQYKDFVLKNLQLNRFSSYRRFEEIIINSLSRYFSGMLSEQSIRILLDLEPLQTPTRFFTPSTTPLSTPATPLQTFLNYF